MENITILYAEDDIEIQNITKDVLEIYATKVLSASNGQEDLELFKNNQIDLLITDITMPLMDGLQLIKEIKKIDPELITIITSAHNDTDFFLKSISLGVDGYLLKPINLENVSNLLPKLQKRIITQKNNKKNQQLLNEYKSIIDSATIVSKSDPDGIITYANEAFCKLSGYTIEELIGSDHNIIRHPDTPVEVFKEMWETILSKRTWKGKVKNLKKNGDDYWVNVTIKPILNTEGEILEFIALRTDITLEMEYQDKLQHTIEQQINDIKKQERYIQLQAKHAAMGEIVDAIAHQWVQPINIISMRSSIINELYEGDDSVPIHEVQECHNVIKEQIDHLHTTLHEFRTFLRPNKKTEIFSVLHTLKSTISLLKDELSLNNINIVFNESVDIHIDGIENEFKHIFINLINNSKDAFIDNNIQNREIHFHFENTNDNKVIHITDNAGGIPPEIINDIFKPNVTSKGDKQGTGIGLYLTSQILDKHEATIKVSNIMNGARFSIFLKK